MSSVKFDAATIRRDQQRPFPSKTPAVDAYVSMGVVVAAPGEYIGRAADGVWVNLGGSRMEAEKYLTLFPLPENW